MSKALKQERSAQSVLSNLGTNVYMTLSGLVISVLVARQLGPELKGEYNALLLISTLYAPLLVFGYSNGVLYYGIRELLDIRRYFWSGLSLIFLLSTAIIGVLIVLMEYGLLGSVIQGIDFSAKILLLSFIPIILSNVYFEKIMRSFHLFKASNKRLIIATSLMLLFYLAYTLIAGGMTLKAAIIGVLISHCSQFTFNIQFIIRKIKVKTMLSLNNIFLPWKYGIQVWMNQMIAKSNNKFDQIILSFLMSSGNFAIYVVGVSFSNLAIKLPESYINVFYNKMVGKEVDFQLNTFKVLQRFTSTMVLCVCIALLLLSGYIIPLMYGNGFIDSVIVVAFYLPGVLFQVLGRFNIKFYAAMGKPLKNSLVYLVGMLTSLPFYFILVPKYGIIGAAIASSIAYFAAYAFSFWQISKDFKVPLIDTLFFRKSDIPFWKVQIAQLRNK